jgi:hypothetical protein
MKNIISELNQKITISRSAEQFDRANTIEDIRNDLTSGEYCVYQVIRTHGDREQDVLATSLDFAHVLQRFNQEVDHFKAMAANPRGLYYFNQSEEGYAELWRKRNDSLRYKLEISRWSLA